MPSAIATDLANGQDTPQAERVALATLRVVITITDERYATLGTAQRAKLCHLTKHRYLALCDDPLVQRLVAVRIKNELTAQAPRVAREMMASAMMPGRDGVNDRKLFFDMAGMLTKNNVSRSETKVVHEIGPGLAAALARESAARLAVPAEGAAPLLIEAATAPEQRPAQPPEPGEPDAGFLDQF
jgi:hypothetical protein